MYPVSSITFAIIFLFSSLTYPLFKYLDTVARETPANFAISLILIFSTLPSRFKINTKNIFASDFLITINIVPIQKYFFNKSILLNINSQKLSTMDNFWEFIHIPTTIPINIPKLAPYDIENSLVLFGYLYNNDT